MSEAETLAFVKKYLEDIVAFFDVNVDVSVTVENDIIIAVVPSNERNSLLIGRNAETLKSIQHLLSTILHNRDDVALNRISLDIADYKKQHVEKLQEKARAWIHEVQESGETKELSLNSADRWVVHNTASEYEDIETYSEGVGRERRLIMKKK